MSTTNSTLVSVIIPTYNHWPNIKKAIASCLDQTHKNVEVVVVDDGSTDNTVGELKALNYSRVRIIENHHTGKLGLLKNIGLKKSTGDWIAFLDSDDIWKPEKLTKQLQALQTKNLLTWCITNYIIRYDEGTSFKNDKAPGLSLSPDNMFEKLLSYNHAAMLHCTLLSRVLQKKVGWFNESLYLTDDYDYLMRLAYHAPAVLVDEPLSVYNKSSNRPWSAKQSLNHNRDMLKVNKFVVPLARKRGLLKLAYANQELHRKSNLNAAKRTRNPFSIIPAYIDFYFSKFIRRISLL